jgi:hypothetical protein
MRDAAFLVVLRAWLLRRRTDRFVADATREPKIDPAPARVAQRPVR